VHTSHNTIPTATVPTARTRQLQENLLTHLAKGREWATPGIEAALHRALTGMDSGLEAASPRIQASLRTIVDELAGGVEAMTPRIHDRISRITQANHPAPDPGAESGRPSRNPWLIAGILAAAALCGATLWRLLRPAGEPSVEPPPEQAPEEQAPETGAVPDDPAASQSSIPS
jgi:hypothetical protein